MDRQFQRVSRPNLPALTSLRFFAALLVLLSHFHTAYGALSPAIGTFGYEAVTFFFVLSGFVLTYAHDETGGMNVSRATFYRLRTARILPAYFVSLIIAAPYYFRHEAADAAGTVSVLMMLQAWWPSHALVWNGPAWSLSNEVFFYALFPLLVLALPARGGIAIACAVVVGTSFVQLALADWHNFVCFFPLINLPQFIFGMALGRLFLRWRPQGNLWSVGLLIASALIGAMMILKTQGFGQLSTPMLLCPMFGLLIVSTAAHGPRILRAPALITLGEASYALYLYHLPILIMWNYLTHLVWPLALPVAVDLCLFGAISISASLVSYLYLEIPLREMIRRQNYCMAPIFGFDAGIGLRKKS